MRRTVLRAMPPAVLVATALSALPAMAQSYGGDYQPEGGVIALLIGCSLFFGLIALLLMILNIWMIIDAATRNDTEFATGDKTLWLVLLIGGLFLGFGLIVAIVYYFLVYRGHPRGRGQGPGYGAAPYGGGYQQPYGQPPYGGQGYAPGYPPPPPPSETSPGGGTPPPPPPASEQPEPEHPGEPMTPSDTGEEPPPERQP